MISGVADGLMEWRRKAYWLQSLRSGRLLQLQQRAPAVMQAPSVCSPLLLSISVTPHDLRNHHQPALVHQEVWQHTKQKTNLH